MKTGRVRQKAEVPPAEPVALAAEPGSPAQPAAEELAPAAQPLEAAPAPEIQPAAAVESTGVAEAPPAPQPSRPAYGQAPAPAPRPEAVTAPQRSGLPISLGCLFGIVVAIIVLILLWVLLSGRRSNQEWIPATAASGQWDTGVTIFGPQVTTTEGWEADCTRNSAAIVRSGSCMLKDTDVYQDQVVDDYGEYAYNIYYEETWSRVYEAEGIQFVATTLGTDEWWDGNRRYSSVEEIDQESCNYTNYTIWVDDPTNPAQETEVYLSECEVWDHVIAYERVYEQSPWCLCDVTNLVQLGRQSQQGSGLLILWPDPNLPSGGQTEQSFQGQVTFTGGDYTFTTTSTDPDEYRRYLSGQYYIAVRNGRPVAVSETPAR